ncbi:MAG: PEP-CTERM sorting domain-containing protein [Phycisphaerae bacterium]|nr:PEP-CTERM sorting domain-containing protein [Phycisphaerae bacterium]
MNKKNYYLFLVITLGIFQFVTTPMLGAAELPDFGSATFAPGAAIDNPYLPYIPGTLYTYEGEGETIKVFVTFDTKDILGVTCTVVQDTVWEEGVVLEDTFDWFAQDTAGNVWYMGEWSTEYEYDDEGNLTGENNDGSWEAGVDGALPGYTMKASPAIGDSYYQEYYVGEAEDEALVTSLIESVSIDLGDFDNTRQIFETSILDPEALEFKYYAQGVGMVLEEGLDDQNNVISSVELVSVEIVPEPMSLGLLGLGGLTLLRKRRT